MTYLPGLDTNDDCIAMTQGQAVITACICYTTAALFVSIFLLALWNTYFFLYKQRKYKVYPILLFYVLSYTCIMLRIYHSIWMVTVLEYDQIIAVIGVTWVKFCIGIIQILVMTELTIRIEQSMHIYEGDS